MAEVLRILAIAIKEIKQSRVSKFILEDGSALLVYISSETFLKKLVRGKDLENALQRLENVTMEEARPTVEEALKVIRVFTWNQSRQVTASAEWHSARSIPKLQHCA